VSTSARKSQVADKGGLLRRPSRSLAINLGLVAEVAEVFADVACQAACDATRSTVLGLGAYVNSLESLALRRR
jgi:hypothetical protein